MVIITVIFQRLSHHNVFKVFLKDTVPIVTFCMSQHITILITNLYEMSVSRLCHGVNVGVGGRVEWPETQLVDLVEIIPNEDPYCLQ